METGSLTRRVSLHGVLSLRGGRGPRWLLLDPEPKGITACGRGGAAPWCQVAESLSLPRASNPGSFPSLLFRPRVHLLQQPQRVEARVLVGPDRGMSLPPSLEVG